MSRKRARAAVPSAAARREHARHVAAFEAFRTYVVGAALYDTVKNVLPVFGQAEHVAEVYDQIEALNRRRQASAGKRRRRRRRHP